MANQSLDELFALRPAPRRTRREYKAELRRAGFDTSKRGQLCVYVLGPENGPIKVGTSRNPYERMAALQTSNSDDLFMFSWLESDREQALKIERQAHYELADARLSGEWFDLDSKFATALVMALAKRFGAKVYRVAGTPYETQKHPDNRTEFDFAKKRIHKHRPPTC